MGTIFNCILIVFIITVVWDISSFISDVSKWLYEILSPGKAWCGQLIRKPFGCSYCMVFHSSWVYLILINDYSVIHGLALACVMTFVGSIMRKLLKKLTYKIETII